MLPPLNCLDTTLSRQMAQPGVARVPRLQRREGSRSWGTDAYVQTQLSAGKQLRFLQVPPTLPALQVALLLLLYCASPRSNYALRMLPPNLKAGFASAGNSLLRADNSGHLPSASGLLSPGSLEKRWLGTAKRSTTRAPCLLIVVALRLPRGQRYSRRMALSLNRPRVLKMTRPSLHGESKRPPSRAEARALQGVAEQCPPPAGRRVSGSPRANRRAAGTPPHGRPRHRARRRTETNRLRNTGACGRRRKATCMCAGGSVVPGSACTAASQAPACGPDYERRPARSLGRMCGRSSVSRKREQAPPSDMCKHSLGLPQRAKKCQKAAPDLSHAFPPPPHVQQAFTRFPTNL